MDESAYDELLRRLTALVVKLDARDDQIMALLEEQREFNKQQVEINAELKTLMQRVFQEHTNGHDNA
jgi:hypothetical protein